MPMSYKCMQFQDKFIDYLKTGMLPDEMESPEALYDYLSTLSESDRAQIRAKCHFEYQAKGERSLTAAPLLNNFYQNLAEGVIVGALVSAATYAATQDTFKVLNGASIITGPITGLLWAYHRVHNNYLKGQSAYADYKRRFEQYSEILPKYETIYKRLHPHMRPKKA